MTSALGLAELLLVLVGIIGWGASELWSLGRGRQSKAERNGVPKAPGRRTRR